MTHMNWNKFFPGTTVHGDRGVENDTETEDEEEITDSNATVSTDKKQYFLGIDFQEFSNSRFSIRCIKSVFIMLNSGMFLAGIIGSVISVWTLTDNIVMSRLIGQRFYVMVLLLVSLIISFVSFIGFFGLLRKRKKYLYVYAFCYLLVLCAIFIGAILSFWIFEVIIKMIQSDMIFSIQNYYLSVSNREAWDNTHRYLKCCGINSLKDWAQYQINIPKSCCSKANQDCPQMTDAVSYKLGCLKSAVLLLKSHVHAISISLVLIFLIAVLNSFLVLCILARMKVCYSRRT